MDYCKLSLRVHIFATTKTEAINIRAHIPLLLMIIFLWDTYPWERVLGQKVYVFLILINVARLLYKEALSIYISASNAENTFFHIAPLTVLSLFKIIASLIDLRWFIANSFHFPISELKNVFDGCLDLLVWESPLYICCSFFS